MAVGPASPPSGPGAGAALTRLAATRPPAPLRLPGGARAGGGGVGGFPPPLPRRSGAPRGSPAPAASGRSGRSGVVATARREAGSSGNHKHRSDFENASSHGNYLF